MALLNKKASLMGVLGIVLSFLGAMFVVGGILLAGSKLIAQPGTVSAQVTILSSLFAGTGLALLVVGLFLFLLARNHPTAELIHHYYLALNNQDYMTAFECLNPDTKTPEGELITQDWYIQRAQASDTAKGRVTSHSISKFKLNPKRANFTVKVTRDEQSYPVHLNVLKKGDDWKINGFDLF